jgi:prepilin-type N-terminal cleavage/methylation domain-containing protein
MKRNGFTLVELLAVIAIMAILVIITLPNIMELYIDAGKRAYIVDVESMIKESERKYISESINSNKITIVSSDSENKLDSSSSNKYDYSFFLDQKGNVNHVIISNGTYCIDSDYVAGIDLYEKLHECDLDFIEVVEGFQKSYVLFGGYYWKVLANVGDFNDFMEELKARNNIHDDSTYDFEETDSDYLLLLYDDNVLPNEPLLKLIN